MPFRSFFAAGLIFLMGACAATQDTSVATAGSAQAFLPDGGPPVVNGLYVEQDPACSKDCIDVLAKQPLALRKRPHPDAPIVATTNEDEWLDWIGGLYRMRPVRGVVSKDVALDLYPGKSIEFKAGDIIYIVDGRGDGSDLPDTGYWFRGAYFNYAAQGFEQDDQRQLIVEWQSFSDAQEAADKAAGAGWWALVKRDNGQRGYVLRYDLDCGWEGKDHSGYCEGGRAGQQPPAPRNCLAHDISPECQAQRSSAEPSTRAYKTPRPFRDCPECPSMVWIPRQRFAAGQYEVTFAEWDACVAAGGCNGYKPSDRGWGRGLRPVINVKWADAQAYVQWLSARTGERYRLLTTQEWTKAAFPGGRRTNYSWGNAEPGCTPGSRNGVAYNACTPQQTLPVGTFQPNAFGLYDTIGNVGEWLQEPYAPGDQRYAIIGSSWASGVESLGGRGGGTPEDLGADTGLRVARER
jgi:hypothetical protein